MWRFKSLNQITMIKLGCVLYFEFIQIHHQTCPDKNMISLQKTSSCLLENNTRVLGNNEADVNNQMSRKYKEENITSVLKRFSSLVGLSLLMYKEQSWVQLLFLYVILSVSWNSWTHVIPSLNKRRFRIYKNINIQQVHNKYEENVGCKRKSW